MVCGVPCHITYAFSLSWWTSYLVLPPWLSEPLALSCWQLASCCRSNDLRSGTSYVIHGFRTTRHPAFESSGASYTIWDSAMMSVYHTLYSRSGGLQLSLRFLFFECIFVKTIFCILTTTILLCACVFLFLGNQLSSLSYLPLAVNRGTFRVVYCCAF